MRMGSSFLNYRLMCLDKMFVQLKTRVSIINCTVIHTHSLIHVRITHETDERDQPEICLVDTNLN